MLVVATADFEVYHEVVTELRERNVTFTTLEPGEMYPAGTSVVITGESDEIDPPDNATVVRASPGSPRPAIEAALVELRGGEGRTIVGIDPGEQPGIAVLSGDVVVATFQVPPEEVPGLVHEEVADAADPLVRIGDGARLIGARLIDELDVPVELVDETGTTPYLGRGTRGLGDVVAAINIARTEGEPIDSRDVEPTAGELQTIQERSRERSAENRTIDTALARRVADGELTLGEALTIHEGADEDEESGRDEE